MKGGTTSFAPFKKGGVGVCETFCPVLRGEGAKGFGPAIFPFCSHPTGNYQVRYDVLYQITANKKVTVKLDLHTFYVSFNMWPHNVQ